MRYININFSECPATEHRILGVQGEHNATVLKITPPEADNEKVDYYRIVFNGVYTKAFYKTDLENGVIELPLESGLTQFETATIAVYAYAADESLLVKTPILSGFIFLPAEAENIDIPFTESVVADIENRIRYLEEHGVGGGTATVSINAQPVINEETGLEAGYKIILNEGTDAEQTIILNHGQDGRDGQAGIAGPAGPQGETGPAGPKGDSADIEDLTEIRAGVAAGLTAANEVQAIADVIPVQATRQNQLADKDFVTSSISTATATFRGTYTDIDELQNAFGDKNDYAFLAINDDSGNLLYKRYKYAGAQTNRLPDEFFEVENIYNTVSTSQWLDLGIVPSNAMRIETAIKANTFNYYNYGLNLFGVKNYGFSSVRYSRGLSFSRGGTAYEMNPPVLNNMAKNTISMGSNGLFVNDVRITELPYGGEYGEGDTLWLFKKNGSTGLGAATGDNTLHFYETKIYENNVLIADFVPCCRETDYQVGMYNLMTGEFITDGFGRNFGYEEYDEQKWIFEYDLYVNGFTAEQWATINSSLMHTITSRGYEPYATQVLTHDGYGRIKWVEQSVPKDGTDGADGADGADGVTYTPKIENGVLSWVNDGDKENPTPVDLVQAVLAAIPLADSMEF